MIHFDRTPRSVVAVCSCGARDVFTSTGPAETWARIHVELAHPDPTRDRARQLTAERERRRYRNR